MKPPLLFSSLFMAALALSPLVAQSKTSHHKHKQINADEKSFPTGTFYQEPTMGMDPPDETGYRDSYEIQTKEDVLVIKKMDSFSGAASMNSDTYLVYFVGTEFATHQYSCRFAGIFEQKTKKKELTLVDSYKKLGCQLKVIAIKEGLGIYAPEQPYDLSCRQFCDGGMGLGFGYNYPHKKSNKHHQH